MYGGRAIMRGF